MELLLWRWSTAVQVTSLLMIAAFFAVLTQSNRRPAVRWWAFAWICNSVALVVTLAFWYFRAERVDPLVRALYMGTKTAFVLLLLHGSWVLEGSGRRQLLRPALLVPGFAVYGLLAAFVISRVEWVGVIQHSLMVVLFAAGGLLLMRRPVESGFTWLAVGLSTRSILSLEEAAAYAVRLAPEVTLPPAWRTTIGIFVSAHSSFDAGIEWFIALGCVLALSARAQRDLLRVNVDLLSAQEDLLKLVERDPLTGLANRRSLPEIFRSVRQRGATLLFCDLDEFKQINDLHGHQAGDECIKRFSMVLGECFRPGDALVRYGGDEFLVVATGLDRDAALERVERLRRRLAEARGDAPALAFSVGLSELAPGGSAEEALSQADLSMYEAKSHGSRASEAVVTL